MANEIELSERSQSRCKGCTVSFVNYNHNYIKVVWYYNITILVYKSHVDIKSIEQTEKRQTQYKDKFEQTRLHLGEQKVDEVPSIGTIMKLNMAQQLN